MKCRYIDLILEATHNAGYHDDMRLVKLVPSALLSAYKLTTRSGKLLGCIGYSHVICSMYHLKTNRRESIDLSIAFDEINHKPKEKLTKSQEAPNRLNSLRNLFFRCFWVH